MVKPARTTPRFTLSKKNRALLAAAWLAFNPAAGGLQAQVDLATIKLRADQGDPEALNALANAHANGQGVAQSFPEALRLYQQAADRGFAAAQFNLGMMYELGRGMAANLPTAFKHYLKAAEQGFAPAQFNVGNMYANGLGVKQDYFEAALWFRQAADRSVPEAQYNLALAYELGRGVAKDEAAAQRWYRQAAVQKYARAQYNLALMLEEGRGSPPDPAAAIELYRGAATQNFAPAQNNLGILLAEGRGSAVNLVDAYVWLALAVENGAKPTGRDIVGQQLTSSQLAEANQGVSRMRPQLGLREPGPGSAVAGAPAVTRPTAPAPTASQAAATPGPSAAEVSALNTRATAAESELERARAENARLTASTQALMREKTILEQRVTAAEASSRAAAAKQPAASDSAALRAQVEQLTRDKTEAQRRADELAEQLAAARTAASVAAASPPGSAPATADATLQQLAAADPRIGKLLADNSRLNDDVKRSTIELAQLSRQLRLAQEKAVAPGPGAEASPADAGKISDLTRQLEDLRTANEKLTGENRRLEAAGAAKGDAPRISQQLADARADLARMRTENEQLKKTATASDEVPVLRQRAAAAEKSLADTAKQRDVLAEEKTALEKRLADASTKAAVDPQHMQQLRAQLGEALDDLTAARKAGDAFKAQLEQANRTGGENSRAAADLAAARQELATTRQQLTEVQQRLTTAQQASVPDRTSTDKLTAQLEAASKTIADLSGKNDSLQKDLEVSKQSAAAALAAQAAAAKAGPGDAMRLEMATMQNQVRALESQLDEDRKNSAREISTLATQLQNVRETNRSLSDANRSLLQTRGSDESAIRAEIDQINARVKTTVTELEKSRAEQARVSTELETRNRELEAARVAARAPAQERDTLRGQVDEMSSRLSGAERQLTQLKQVADGAKAEAEKARTDYAALQLKHVETAKAVEQHGSSVAELTGLNEKLAADKTVLERQLAQSRQSSEFARGEVAELKTLLVAREKMAQEKLSTVDELGTANEKLQAQVKDLGAQMTALRADNARLTAAGESAGSMRTEVAELKTQLADARKAGEQHGAAVAELTGSNEKLSNTLVDLQAQLVALRADNSRLAQGDAARQDAEQRVANLTAAAAQLATAQRDLSGARAEIARLNDSVQVLERDRSSRITQLQQENAAITARLRQAQGTLDQIASAARLINGGGTVAPSYPAPSAPPPSASMPSSTPVTPAPRIHTVTEGDSLTRISVRYYGTSNRWQEIYDANREVLKGENALRPGQRLRIP